MHKFPRKCHSLYANYTAMQAEFHMNEYWGGACDKSPGLLSTVRICGICFLSIGLPFIYIIHIGGLDCFGNEY